MEKKLTGFPPRAQRRAQPVADESQLLRRGVAYALHRDPVGSTHIVKISFG
jgi:hypothetical protein